MWQSVVASTKIANILWCNNSHQKYTHWTFIREYDKVSRYKITCILWWHPLKLLFNYAILIVLACMIKGNPAWDIDVGILFCMKHCIPAAHNFNFLINIKNLDKTPTKYLYTKRMVNASTTLGHMLMPSAQRRADNRWCRVPPPPPIISFPRLFDSRLFDPAVRDGGYLWYKVLYNAHSCAYMTISDLEIKLA